MAWYILTLEAYMIVLIPIRYFIQRIPFCWTGGVRVYAVCQRQQLIVCSSNVIIPW